MAIPYYFQDALERKELELHSFAYDASVNSFLVANEKVSSKDFAEHAGFVHEIEPDIRTEQDLENSNAFISGYGMEFIATKKLHDWVLNADFNELRVNVIDAMRKTFASFYDDEFDLEPEDYSGGFMSFDFHLTENKSMNFNVLGNCACSGVSYPSLGAIDPMEEGYGSYDLHNIDTPVQLASIRAGLGHVAFLASGREPAQDKLF
jgi:hypothetical protein